MPICKMLWGASSSGASPHYENELLLGYPAYDWITDRVPREGSEFAQAPSGVEDAWITGRDYVFEGEFRFIPDKPSTSPERSVVAGPNSWQAFLDYCRDKNDFRFVPNVNTPDFYVEKCYLVEPIRGFGGNLADLTRGVRLVMRTTSMDFTQAMRGVAFEYKAGAQLQTYSSGASFSRASAGTFDQRPSTNSQGDLVGEAGSGVLRDRHMSSSGLRLTLLEPASTNLILHPVAIDNAAWLKVGLSVTANDRLAPDAARTTSADKLIASTSAGSHYTYQAKDTITGGEVVALVAHVRAAELGRLRYYAQVTTGTNLMGMEINSSAGTVAAYTGGVGAVTVGPIIRSLDDQWYEIRVAGTLNSSSTSADVLAQLMNSTGNTTFAGATSGQGLHFWGASFARQKAPESYIASSSATASRAADTLAFDWFAKPQAGWVHVRFQELGSIANTGEYLAIDTTGGAYPLYRLRNISTALFECVFGASSSQEARATLSSTGVSYLDVVDLFGHLSTDGGVTIRRAVNGGAETASTSTGVSAFPSTWSAARLHLGGRGSLQAPVGFAEVKGGFSTGVTTIATARSA